MHLLHAASCNYNNGKASEGLQLTRPDWVSDDGKFTLQPIRVLADCMHDCP